LEEKKAMMTDPALILIGALQPADWEAVRAVYLEGIATGEATFETEAPSWEQWAEGDLAHSRLAARQASEVVGWAALSPVSRRRAYCGVAEVSIYVRAAQRGRGIGTRLLRALIDSSEKNGIWTLQGATFGQNVASLKLQQACGFRIVGRRERIGQHHGLWRDSVLTERRSRIVGC